MWQVIYIAPSRTAAERLRDQLAGDGILVSLRSLGPGEGDDGSQVELLVPRGEVQEAHQALSAAIGRSRARR